MSKVVLVVLGFAFGLFHLGTAYFGTLVGQQQAAVHLTLAILIGSASMASQSAGWAARGFTLLVAVLGALPATYVIYLDLTRAGMVATPPGLLESVMAFALVVCLLVMTKQLLGWALPTIVVLFTIYPYVGHHVTTFQDEPFTTTQVVFQLYSYTEGIFGTPLMVSGTFVAVFLVYGALLERTGGGQFFLDLAMAAFGRVRGGPAKVSVLASGALGSINGSAVANVVTTGSVTIPLMKKVGLRPHYAGAAESAASSGGQLMPPIMGASAFILAQMTGIPYQEVAIAAIIPAVLYFWALIVDIDLEAGRLGIISLEKHQLPSPWQTLRTGWPHLVSPVVLIYLLMIAGLSPVRAGLYSVLTMLIVTLVKRSTRWNLKSLFEGMQAGAQSAVPVALATAGAGIIIGSLSLTGLGLRISGLLVEASGGNVLVLLLMTMVASIILGLGLPTVAAYLILAITIAPALIQLDVPPLAAHLFIFYFGVMSASTPPVALAAFAAAGIAGSSPMRTALSSVRLGWIAFIVPFLFIYNPALLATGTPLSIVLAVVSALIAVAAVTGAAQGHMITSLSLVQRMVFGVGGLLLLTPGIITDLPGYVLTALSACLHFRTYRSYRSDRAVVTEDPGERSRTDDGTAERSTSPDITTSDEQAADASIPSDRTEP